MKLLNKTFLALFLLFFAKAVFCQGDFLYDTQESIKPLRLKYDTLYPANIEYLKKDTKYPNIIVSQVSVWTQIIYKIKNSDKWISFLTKLTSKVDIQLLNIDKKGEKELIIKGYNYTSSDAESQTKRNITLVFSIDSIPTQLLSIVTSCKDTTFTFTNNGETQKSNFDDNNFFYKRSVSIAQDRVIIKEPFLNNVPFGDKTKRNIPSGTYILSNGEFRQKK